MIISALPPFRAEKMLPARAGHVSHLTKRAVEQTLGRLVVALRMHSCSGSFPVFRACSKAVWRELGIWHQAFAEMPHHSPRTSV